MGLCISKVNAEDSQEDAHQYQLDVRKDESETGTNVDKANSPRGKPVDLPHAKSFQWGDEVGCRLDVFGLIFFLFFCSSFIAFMVFATETIREVENEPVDASEGRSSMVSKRISRNVFIAAFVLQLVYSLGCSALNGTLYDIRNAGDLEDAKNLYNNIIKATPTVILKAEAYHIEEHTNSKGTIRTKVVTKRGRAALEFKSWSDASTVPSFIRIDKVGDTLHGSKKLLRYRLKYIYRPADEATSKEFERQRQLMKQLYDTDKRFSLREELKLSTPMKSLLTMRKEDSWSCLLSIQAFWLFFLMGLSFLYSTYVEVYCRDRRQWTNIKELSIQENSQNAQQNTSNEVETVIDVPKEEFQ